MGKIPIGFLTVIVGATGTGKSVVSHYILDKVKAAVVLDIQDEYKLPWISEKEKIDKSNPKVRISPELGHDTDTIKKIIKSCTGFTFFMEESTGYIDSDYFRSKEGKELIQLIVAKRHAQRVGGGNNYVFVFHSLASIPPKLWPYVDFVFMFPTTETTDIERRFPLLLSASELVRNSGKKIKVEPLPTMLKDSGVFEISDFEIVPLSKLALDNMWFVEQLKINYLQV